MQLRLTILFVLSLFLSSCNEGGLAEEPVTEDKEVEIVSRNILSSVPIIIGNNPKDSVGSCVFLRYKRGMYLVTAKHLFDINWVNGDSVTFRILSNGNNISLTRKVLLHNDPNVDVAVFPAELKDSFTSGILLDSTLQLAAKAFMLGYPGGHGMRSSSKYYPRIREISFSGEFSIDFGTSTVPFHIYDGFSSGGFSGAPLIIPYTDYVIGIVHGHDTDANRSAWIFVVPASYIIEIIEANEP